ncbi:MAG: hypothetical protein QM598_04810 [Protaetiibacter sp.]
MWTPDDFPGADHVPWQLLIRARFVFELDALVASRVTHALAAVLPAKASGQLGRLATHAVAGSPRDELGAETVVRALAAYADFDDWCGTKWPRWPFPFPGPRHLDDVIDPLAVATLERARAFVAAAGSPELQKGLGAALDEVAGSFRG